MTPFEHIFDSALQELRNGKSVAQVLAMFPEQRDELTPLLEVAATGLAVPKLIVPHGVRRYKFAELSKVPYTFAHFLNFFRIAIIPISLIAVLFGGNFVVTATENSLPGDRLYTLKRATEEARLSLATNEDKVASIHVALTQKRIEEVKKAITSNNKATEEAALTALKEQTEKTLAAATPVAAANAITKNDSRLLENLVAITKEQKDLLTSIAPEPETEAAAKTALTVAKSGDKTFAKIVATVHEQSLSDLTNKVTVTGEATVSKDGKITVEKNVFITNETTAVTNAEGEKLAISDIKGTITIIGTKDKTTLIAKQIILVPSDDEPSKEPVEPEGEVKGDTTTTKPVDPVKKPQPLTPKPNPDPIPPTNTPGVTPQPNTNNATGSYIVEPSASQYVP